MRRQLSRMVLWLLRGYRWLISPLLGQNCRFYPSCSCYAHAVISNFGLWRGGWLMFYRVLRCQPYCEGGFDFPPPQFTWFPPRNLQPPEGCPF